MDLGLEGVPALVGGGSRGIGFAAARALVEEGARVIIASRHEEPLREACERLSSSRGEVGYVVADLSTPDGPAKAVRHTVERLGGLQVLVANSGGPPQGGAAERTDDEWMAGIDMSFLSIVRAAREAIPHLKKSPWGRIVAVTSMAAKEPIATLALSNAARAAAHGFLKTLAGEVGSHGITVNAVMPHYILTDRVRSVMNLPPDAGPDHPTVLEAASSLPLRRMGAPDEIGSVIAFLCSTKAGFLTGLSVPVDGGSSRGLL